MESLKTFATARLEAIWRDDLYRRIVDTDRCLEAAISRDGKRLISFSCNDYLGLSQHPAVRQAAIEAAGRWGTGAGASRLITGSHSLYRELEARLAAIKGTEAACVFGSGYLVNSGVIPCFAGKGDLILIDELAHSCLFAGTNLARSATLRFGHNDIDDLGRLLAGHRGNHRRCLIVTEGVFSMDGDLAPLAELTRLAEAADAWLLCDDAHGFGVIGSGGGGSCFAHEGAVDVPLQTGTLSKAVGGYGGFVCGAAAVIDLVRNRARTLIYSTGLPPATLAAAIAAIDILRSDAGLREAPLAKARLFAAELGLPEPRAPIIPVIVGDAGSALEISRALEEKGYLVTAIRPPTVPPGTARLRITFSAAHRDEDVLGLAAALGALHSFTGDARAVAQSAR